MTFATLNLIEPLQRALSKEGYTTPTPIQIQAIPPLLEGRDVVGIAQTGTGKTAAFVLPMLQRMTQDHKVPMRNSPRVLVLAPTRELAAQIGQSFSAYGRFLRFRHTVIFGGVGQGPQVNALSQGVDILVATPGRLLDLIEQRYVKLSNVEFLVLDEADRMLDMGFIVDVRKIVALVPQKRQTLLFSATMSPPVTQLARSLLKDPVRVEVTPEKMTVERIEQKVLFVDEDKKGELLLGLVRQGHLKCVLVFTRTKHRANKVAEMLEKSGIKADAIHGNKSQSQRMRALQNFKTGRVQVLVATDIAARGIDIDAISHVINYDLPNEPESYVHRIGRTARAGADGTAYSFCASEDRDFLRDIERLTRTKIETLEHPHHSERAMNAVGTAARPPPKQQWGGQRRFNRGGSGGHGGGNRGAPRHFKRR
ncbi:MAG: DEAD/DEAH box helicase [Nanoarchaeota archaeon]|nr:DEAD/DEAH box helicase [Nanoarchaeota archaeon]